MGEVYRARDTRIGRGVNNSAMSLSRLSLAPQTLLTGRGFRDSNPGF
jgi:hypothetical protein